MQCPKGHGEMRLYEETVMHEKYVCTDSSCNVRLDLNTDTGKIVQVATGIAAIGAAVGVVASILFGAEGS